MPSSAPPVSPAMFRLLVVSASLAGTAGFVSPRPSALGRVALRKAVAPRAAAPPMMLLGGLFGRGPASEAGGLADNEAASRMSPITVGIVGATGAVGEEIMGCLKERGVPVSSIELFASARSAGKEIDTPFGKKKLQEFDLAAARKLDVVFLAVSGDFALEWAEKIAEGDDGALEGCCRSQRKIAGAVGGHQGCGRVSPRATPVRPRSVTPLIGGSSGVCDRRTPLTPHPSPLTPLTPHPSPPQARSSSTTRRPSVTLRASRSWCPRSTEP